MISCPTVRKDLIRSHYNLATPFYWLLWGRHLHHGLWEGTETAACAQQQLTETLAREAGIRSGERVLDVGCGMGGSSIFLAKSLGCRVDGLTISSIQRAWARASAMRQRVSARTTFHCADAEVIEFEPETFDVVWSIECTEHLFDKPMFFRRLSRWLHGTAVLRSARGNVPTGAGTGSGKNRGGRVRGVSVPFSRKSRRLSAVVDSSGTRGRSILRLDRPRDPDLGDLPGSRATFRCPLACPLDQSAPGALPRSF